MIATKKRCPYCKFENDEKEKFCLNCGRPIQDIHMIHDRIEVKEFLDDIKRA